MTSDSRCNGQHEPRETPLECRTEVIGECVVIRVTGEVDLATVPVLERALDAALAAPKSIVVDFEGARYIDSTGLRALIRAGQRHRHPLAVCALGPTLRRVFELTNVDQAIPLYGTLSDALHALCQIASPSEVAG